MHGEKRPRRSRERSKTRGEMMAVRRKAVKKAKKKVVKRKGAAAKKKALYYGAKEMKAKHMHHKCSYC